MVSEQAFLGCAVSLSLPHRGCRGLACWAVKQMSESQGVSWPVTCQGCRSLLCSGVRQMHCRMLLQFCLGFLVERLEHLVAELEDLAHQLAALECLASEVAAQASLVS